MSVSTDGEERCACCDLPLYSCGAEVVRRQAQERRALRERALQRPGVVAARHRGRCPSCGQPFGVGEPVRKTPDGWVSVLCCPEQLDD